MHSNKDHEDQIKVLLDQLPGIMEKLDDKVGMDMFDEDLDKIKEVFLNNLSAACEADPATKIASATFLTIAKRKQT